MCLLLKVSTSGYYDWVSRAKSERTKVNRVLLTQIKAIHQESRETYGSPRMHVELKEQGYVCGKNRVARLMRSAGIETVMKKLWRKSRRGKTFEYIEESKLQRQFYAEQPNERWVSDITQIPTAQGWLYLAVVMDLYSRLIVGWSMSSHAYNGLVEEALTMALWKRRVKKGLLIHSDRGAQYRTSSYNTILKAHGIECSMSRIGNCHDNAAMESFFHTLKTELTHHHRYLTRDDARQDIFEYIEVFYNRQRRHSYLNYMTPFEFEKYNEIP